MKIDIEFKEDKQKIDGAPMPTFDSGPNTSPTYAKIKWPFWSINFKVKLSNNSSGYNIPINKYKYDIGFVGNIIDEDLHWLYWGKKTFNYKKNKKAFLDCVDKSSPFLFPHESIFINHNFLGVKKKILLDKVQSYKSVYIRDNKFTNIKTPKRSDDFFEDFTLTFADGPYLNALLIKNNQQIRLFYGSITFQFFLIIKNKQLKKPIILNWSSPFTLVSYCYFDKAPSPVISNSINIDVARNFSFKGMTYDLKGNKKAFTNPNNIIKKLIKNNDLVYEWKLKDSGGNIVFNKTLNGELPKKTIKLNSKRIKPIFKSRTNANYLLLKWMKTNKLFDRKDLAKIAPF